VIVPAWCSILLCGFVCTCIICLLFGYFFFHVFSACHVAVQKIVAFHLQKVSAIVHEILVNTCGNSFAIFVCFTRVVSNQYFKGCIQFNDALIGMCSLLMKHAVNLPSASSAVPTSTIGVYNRMRSWLIATNTSVSGWNASSNIMSSSTVTFLKRKIA
jgi:hypothetical protein